MLRDAATALVALDAIDSVLSEVGIAPRDEEPCRNDAAARATAGDRYYVHPTMFIRRCPALQVLKP
jgi:hypothetical protein